MRRLMLYASAALASTLLIVLTGGGLPRWVPSFLPGNHTEVSSGATSTRSETLLAARYHLRNRTKQFFERAKQPREYAPVAPAPRKHGTGQTAVSRPPQACPHHPAHPATEARVDRVVREK